MQKSYMRMAVEELRAQETLEIAAKNKENQLDELALRLQINGRINRSRLEKRQARLSSELALLRSRIERCRRALDTLNDRQRYLIEHLYVSDDSVLDIMEALRIEKTAYYRLRRQAAAAFVRAMYGVELRDGPLERC